VHKGNDVCLVFLFHLSSGDGMFAIHKSAPKLCFMCLSVPILHVSKTCDFQAKRMFYEKDWLMF